MIFYQPVLAFAKVRTSFGESVLSDISVSVYHPRLSQLGYLIPA